MPAPRRLFITLEGPEGSGKSSQARWLVGWLRRQGAQVVAVRDPGSTALGCRLRRVLLHNGGLAPSPMAEALLFIAGRVGLVEQLIRPALAQGRIVVCDRFHDSTIAYQGFGGKLDIAWLEAMARRAIGGLLPDLTILLDVPPAVGFGRLGRHRDQIERRGAAFHRRVRKGFLKLAARAPRRFRVIDATRSHGRVRQDVRRAVAKRFNLALTED
ncbi:MAG: dTMP kinase [Candidatus Omnitrophica bacterium]|nr:dTMP kinase [Candidatus Omnitrophota bacterium]